jgi:uncharacterized protein YgbK (DUF1537 family)
MYQNVNNVISHLPPEFPFDLLLAIREEFMRGQKTIVVFDDDPTGTQTCHDVMVLTTWTVDLIAEELRKKPSILFILTNSRSMPESAAVELTLEIGRNLKEAVTQSGRSIVAISRSDSTLRGHFPAEVRALAQALKIEDAVWILLPAFIEGGRFTIEDVHYIVEQQELIPVADTPFAKDHAFGYSHSNVKEWIEEKTKGGIKAKEVISFSLEDIRIGGPSAIAEKLTQCLPGQVCVVNAVSYKDLEVFTMGLLLTEKLGKTFLLRSSATFVPIRAGIAPGKIVAPEKNDVTSSNGSLVVVGSYVPKTTLQLNYLLSELTHQPIEVDVTDLLKSTNPSQQLDLIVRQTDQWLSSGKDVVIYTSRKLELGSDAESNLKINGVVSTFLISIVKGLTIRPSFIIAKGGITSSDLASKGLSAKKALILGQAIPGVPVWKLDIHSKFPEIVYIVFPGNVGGEAALSEVSKRFKFNS